VSVNCSVVVCFVVVRWVLIETVAGKDSVFGVDRIKNVNVNINSIVVLP